jgi:hypothetical protein
VCVFDLPGVVFAERRFYLLRIFVLKVNFEVNRLHFVQWDIIQDLCAEGERKIESVRARERKIESASE